MEILDFCFITGVPVFSDLCFTVVWKRHVILFTDPNGVLSMLMVLFKIDKNLHVRGRLELLVYYAFSLSTLLLLVGVLVYLFCCCFFCLFVFCEVMFFSQWSKYR